MKNENDNLLIKVPIFVSDSISGPNNEIGLSEYNLNLNNLINDIETIINKYNTSKKVVSKSTKNKTTTKNIDSIAIEKITLGEDPAILLKINYYSSNLYGKYLENKEKIQLNPNDKIGSENYYAILYPIIYGDTYKWIILIYDDPNSDSKDIINSIKLVLRKILNIKVVNIKPKEILEKMEKDSSYHLSLKLFSSELNDNEIDYNLKEYLLSSKINKVKEAFFDNVPFNKIKEILNDVKFTNFYKKRNINIRLGKQEFKLNQELKGANESLFETAEEIFNYSTEVSMEEIENGQIYDTNFIIQKMQPVLINYLTTNIND